MNEMMMCRHCYGDIISFKRDSITYVDMCDNCKKEIDEFCVHERHQLEYELDEIQDQNYELNKEIIELEKKLKEEQSKYLDLSVSDCRVCHNYIPEENDCIIIDSILPLQPKCKGWKPIK